jgi:hypothetical protein
VVPECLIYSLFSSDLKITVTDRALSLLFLISTLELFPRDSVLPFTVVVRHLFGVLLTIPLDPRFVLRRILEIRYALSTILSPTCFAPIAVELTWFGLCTTVAAQSFSTSVSQ